MSIRFEHNCPGYKGLIINERMPEFAGCRCFLEDHAAYAYFMAWKNVFQLQMENRHPEAEVEAQKLKQGII